MENIHLFSRIADYLEVIIVSGGYSILFLTTFLEGIPLIGMAIPGHVAIIFGGFLAKIGTLNLTYVLIVAAVGAILGDCIGFFLGRRYGLSFIDKLRPYFFIKNEHITKAQQLLTSHTGKAMIIGRFSPLTRALMPFLVGSSKTATKKFWFYNIIGGVSWVCASVFLGYIFGASYHSAVGYFGKFVVGAIIATVLIAWGYRFVNMRFHIFAKYEVFTLILNILSLWVLARMIQDAISPNSFMKNFDVWVSIFVHEHLSPLLIKIAYIVSHVANTQALLAIGLCIGAYLAFYKRWRRAGITFMAIASTAVCMSIMKDYFIRARPDYAYELLSSFSFPSGHASLAAAFFFILAYLTIPRMKSVIKREMVIVLCVCATILIGLSRIVLNVHWASDVIAGWALGTFLATSSVLVVRYVAGLITRKSIQEKL